MPVASTELIKRVYTQADKELSRVGMVRRKEGIYTRELDQNDLGWLGLNRAVRRGDGALELNPVVGLRNQPLERLVAQLSDQPIREYSPPSISVHLGYLRKDRSYSPWLFDSSGATEGRVRDMADAIAKDGVPFMQSNVGLENLSQSLPKYASGQSQRLRIPAALLLLGDYDAARKFVEDELRKLEGVNTPASEQYRLFARNLIAVAGAKS